MPLQGRSRFISICFSPSSVATDLEQSRFTMILPSSPNRLWLLSFWLAICLLAGMTTGIALWVLASPAWSGLGLILTAALAMMGLLRPILVAWPYKVWNGLAGSYTRLARMWVAKTCFYIIFGAVGRTGAALSLTRPTSVTESYWVPRDTLPSKTYVHEYKKMTEGSTRSSWIRTFVSWAVGSRNLWACCLLPFLILLRALETEEKRSFPSNIYTLY